RGAYVAYRRIIETLSPWFGGIQPLPAAAFTEVRAEETAGDCAMLLSLPDRFPEEKWYLRLRTPTRAQPTDPGITLPVHPTLRLFIMEQGNAPLPRALVFRDSFGAQLVPFLSEHFQRTVFAWQDLSLFDTQLVERERPNVVIQEMVERK